MTGWRRTTGCLTQVTFFSWSSESTKATLREILLGPARVDDGSQNFAGALRSALGVCGARDIAEFQHTEMVIAPSIVSEGKVFQQAQHVGMGKS